MTRRAKILLFLTSLLILGVGSVVLNNLQLSAGSPFPGSVVILDDASWRAQFNSREGESAYLWATHDTVLYIQKTANGQRIIRRHVTPERTFSPPEILPMPVGPDQCLHSLSPNGKILCLTKSLAPNVFKYNFVSIDGVDKLVILNGTLSCMTWMPDSRAFYGYVESSTSSEVQRFTLSHGKIAATRLSDYHLPSILQITPQGRLLCFYTVDNPQGDTERMEWSIADANNPHAAPVTSQQRGIPRNTLLSLSPDGKRILWTTMETKITWWEQMQQKISNRYIAAHPFSCYWITDADGSNKRDIGSVPMHPYQSLNYRLHWTPDSKGIHFLQDGKLMYLTVP